jgi:hypothetical protein
MKADKRRWRYQYEDRTWLDSWGYGPNSALMIAVEIGAETQIGSRHSASASD